MTYEHKAAYLINGEAEGFVGTGSTKVKAKVDLIDQIKRKLDIINSDRDQENDSLLIFVRANLLESPSRLASDQIANVQRDWQSGVRY